MNGTDCVLDFYANERRKTPRHKWVIQTVYSRTDQRDYYNFQEIKEHQAFAIIQANLSEFEKYIREKIHVVEWSGVKL